MIPLTRLDGSQFWLSRAQVQSVEATPDTMILLINGRRILVREGVDLVVRAMSEPGHLAAAAPRPAPRRGGVVRG